MRLCEVMRIAERSGEKAIWVRIKNAYAKKLIESQIKMNY